ncbi:hypothetical protein Lesp02_78890 [Lentzea sp. NBRC 105346]|uniref:hypothetical protein n=1 Tax=Lentzea sp. NBRC 105346 TaxID=3032205 RepID=UPI0024A06923|nr:hypothetical protein [Lentzea sp. NBRC 105346]GLZ35702.1 hypothetical protein Lesp02_78890 [Lentzea sp. NBRC 105346]
MKNPVVLIIVGLAAMVASVAVGGVVPDGWELAVMVPGVLLALAFVVGIGGLSRSGWLMIPAFVVAITGTTVLVGDGPRALLAAFGTPEQCVVTNVRDLGHQDTKAFEHDVTCGGKPQQIVVLGERTMPLGEATVLRIDPMRPVFRDHNDYSREWVIGLPVAVITLLISAVALRTRRVMRQA